MTKAIWVILLVLGFASLSRAETASDIKRLRELPSTIRCLYTGLSVEGTNQLREFFFYRLGETDMYRAEELFNRNREFLEVKSEVVTEWTAQFSQSSDCEFALSPTEGHQSNLKLTIVRKGVPYVYHPPTAGGISMENIGNMPKYVYDFICDGGPLPTGTR